jgi:pyruvate/2-oxoglutarate dehydrogenase complex dihydrolipoamide acyltransferase (E2) component
MSIEVKVPVLPESVSDATIATWHKKAGDAVKRDENLVDLETDKVVLEVPSPVDGVLKEIRHEVGDTVNSEQIIAIIEEGAAAALTKKLIKPSLMPWVFWNCSPSDLRILVTSARFTSLNEVSMAIEFFDCIRRSAILARMRVIGTRSSGRAPGVGLAAGAA